MLVPGADPRLETDIKFVSEVINLKALLGKLPRSLLHLAGYMEFPQKTAPTERELSENRINIKSEQERLLGEVRRPRDLGKFLGKCTHGLR